jgi:acetyl esterase/lipase
MDLRLPPTEKPAPPSFPSRDPLFFLLPLFDAYAYLARDKHRSDPRLNPILADSKTLPKDILMIVAGVDILRHEQQSFIDRIQSEKNLERRIQQRIFEGKFHGWSECECLFEPMLRR